MTDPLERMRQEGRLTEHGVNLAALADAKVSRAVLPGMEPAEPGSSFEATVPWPPSVNDYYVRWVVSMPGKKPFIKAALSPAANNFRSEVAFVVGRVKPLTGPLAMSIVLFEPDLGKHDIDNLNKGILDALTHAHVFADDKQVRRLIVSYGPLCRPNGKVAVRIVPLADIRSALAH